MSESKPLNYKFELKQFMQLSPDLICIFDRDGIFLEVSESAMHILGYSPKELKGRHYEHFLVSNDHILTKKKTNDLIDLIPDEGFINRYTHKSGATIYLQWSSKYDKNTQKFYGIARDITKERKLAQEKEIKNRINEALIDSTQDLIWSLDLNYNFTSFNKAFKQSRGEKFNAKISIGANTFDAIEFPEDVYQYWKNLYDKVFAGEDIQLEYKSEINTKEPYKAEWHSVEMAPISLNNEIIGLVGKSTDISTNKKATEILKNQKMALKEAYQEKEAILEDISDAFYALDDALNFIFINKHAFKGTYNSPDELLGRNLFEAFPDLKDTLFHKKILNVLASEKSEYFEFYYKKFDKWFEERIYKTEIGYSVFFVDITEKKQLSLSLQESYETNSEILESITDGFLAISASNEIIFINNIAIKAFDTSDHEIVGKNLEEVFPKEEAGLVYAKLHACKTKKMSQTFEFIFKPTGNWFSINIYPSEHGASIYFRNITKQKKSALQLVELNKSLELKNSELEQFTYAASHDLQEPLRMITGMMDLLKIEYKHKLEDDALNLVNQAIEGGQRMRQIIVDLLEYSHASNEAIKIEHIDSNDILDEVRKLLQNPIKSSDAIIKSGELPTLQFNATVLRQLFMNLIGNGLKYQLSNKIPLIEISCKQEEGRYVFCVKDNGIGIDERYHQQIFTIFKRLHNKNQYQGTGIGLAICKKIIEKYGGNIWIESAAGKGSAFFFTVPFYKTEE